MSARELLSGAALVSALLGAACPAAAGPPPPPDPAVVELYREARELVNTGRWDEACPKFEQAMRKQPTASILINVGDCHAHAGKLAKAFEDYEVARELNRETRDDGRRVALASEIELRLRKLAPRVPKLRIAAEGASAGMVIRVDGDLIEADKLGAPLSVDPGAHEVTGEAPGLEAEPQLAALAEGESKAVTLRFRPRPFTSQYRGTLVLGVTTLALAGAGAALAGWTELSAAKGARDDASAGEIATAITFGAAGAAAGATLLVYLLAERPRQPRVEAAVSGTFATVRLRW